MNAVEKKCILLTKETWHYVMLSGYSGLSSAIAAGTIL